MFARRRIAVLLALVTTATLVLSGCAQQAPAEKVIKVGAALSLTGGLAREGSLVKEGYDILFNKVNEAGGVDVGGEKYQIEVTYYDDQSDGQRSTKLVEKLITEDGIKFILGPYGSGITVASSVISEKQGAIMIATQATADNIYQRDFKYLFGTMGYATWVVRVGYELAVTQTPKPSTVAVLTADSLFPLKARDGDHMHAPGFGLDIVYDEKFPMDVTDLSPILSQVRAADPDIVTVHGYFDHSVLVVKQLKELGWNPRMLVMDVGPTMPDFSEVLGEDADYPMSTQYWGVTSFYDDPIFGSTENYISEFTETYGKPPDYHNVSASVGAMCYVLGIEAAGSLDVDKVRDAIKAINTETIYGPLFFDEGGMNVGVPGVVLQVQNGEVVSVYPPETAGGDAWYPMPPWSER